MCLSPLFVFDKDLVQVTSVMMKNRILDLLQKAYVHFYEVLLQKKQSISTVKKTDLCIKQMRVGYSFVTHWNIDEHFFDLHAGKRLSQRLHEKLWVLRDF